MSKCIFVRVFYMHNLTGIFGTKILPIIIYSITVAILYISFYIFFSKNLNLSTHDYFFFKLTQMQHIDFNGKTINGFRFEKRLGSGNYGVTYLCTHIQSGRTVAIKTLDTPMADLGPIEDEVETLRDLSTSISCGQSIQLHMKTTKNIACYYNSFNQVVDNRTVIFIVMEYVNGKSLRDFIVQHNRRLPPTILWPLFFQLLNGLKQIHSRGYAHRDIKPENIMITSDNIIKYIDFGFTCVDQCRRENCTNLCNGVAGTPLYLPPEIFNSNTPRSLAVSQAHDIWSLALVMFEMANGSFNFPFYSYIEQNGTPVPLSIQDLVPQIRVAPTLKSNYRYDDNRTNYFIEKLLVNNWLDRPRIDNCMDLFLQIIVSWSWDGNPSYLPNMNLVQNVVSQNPHPGTIIQAAQPAAVVIQQPINQ